MQSYKILNSYIVLYTIYNHKILGYVVFKLVFEYRIK